jgi:hypothetical protein
VRFEEVNRGLSIGREVSVVAEIRQEGTQHFADCLRIVSH